MTIDANQPLPGTGRPRTWLPVQQRRPLYPFNPDITFMITTTARGVANYNALQTTFKQRLWHGLDFNANYTWSKAMTNSRGFFGSAGVAAGHVDLDAGEQPRPRRELRPGVLRRHAHRSRSPAATSCRSARTGAFGSSWNRALDAVAGGWSLQLRASSAHTGYPITVLDSSAPSLQASRSTERPDRIGSGEVDDPTLERWIDRAAFVSAPLGQFGDSGIGILRAPSYWNVDLSVGKRLATFGRQYLMFRGELFNALNHPNFGPPQREHPEHGLRHHHQHGQRSRGSCSWWRSTSSERQLPVSTSTSSETTRVTGSWRRRNCGTGHGPTGNWEIHGSQRISWRRWPP